MSERRLVEGGVLAVAGTLAYTFFLNQVIAKEDQRMSELQSPLQSGEFPDFEGVIIPQDVTESNPADAGDEIDAETTQRGLVARAAEKMSGFAEKAADTYTRSTPETAAQRRNGAAAISGILALASGVVLAGTRKNGN
jgi:hypothetical protein